MNEIEKQLFMERTKIYNLIILDKSGSMFDIRNAAINGFNETLGSIQAAQKKYQETQEHYLTFVTFCGCGIEHVYDNIMVDKAHKITSEEYTPCCNTPLYDAIGFTLTKMKKHIKPDEDSTAVVTIITDGEENSSEEYNLNTSTGTYPFAERRRLDIRLHGYLPRCEVRYCLTHHYKRHYFRTKRGKYSRSFQQGSPSTRTFLQQGT